MFDERLELAVNHAHAAALALLGFGSLRCASDPVAASVGPSGAHDRGEPGGGGCGDPPLGLPETGALSMAAFVPELVVISAAIVVGLVALCIRRESAEPDRERGRRVRVRAFGQ